MAENEGKIAMQKKTIFLLSVVLTLPLAGCSSAIGKTFIDDQMMKKSGVLEDDNYKQYQQMVTEDRIDSDGYFTDKLEEDKEPQGQIHVTFAKNSNLETQYYLDSAHEKAIDTSDCYLNPGTSIYAVVTKKDDVFSSMYDFSSFRIYEFDKNGKRVESSDLRMTDTDDGQVLNIPDSFSGTDISIEPVGLYQQGTINLNDYCTDDNGNQNSLAGTWLINNKECTDDSYTISPVSTYLITYQFDSDEYFFLSSDPKCFYVNNEDGIVIFSERKPNDDTDDYSVELHKYISAVLVSDMDRQVSVNNEEIQNLKANSELPIGNLKYGDKVTITTDKEWPALENNKELILTNSENLSGGKYKYTLIVPEKDGEFLFDPSEYTYEHGSLTFKCFGEIVTMPQMLAKGTKIYYEQAEASPGYWLAGSDHYITVGEETDTKEALQAIHFTPKVQVTVELPQPKSGGTITYELNGKEIKDDSTQAYSGDTITMKFTPWEGWFINSEEKAAKYIVSDAQDQTAKVNIDDTVISVDEVLKEDVNHKPELSLTLDKSVGDNMEFSLTASEFSSGEKHYGSSKDRFNFISNSETVIKDEKIGTDQPIQITMSNRAIQHGTAVRMIVTMTDSDGKETEETEYYSDLNNPIPPIYIYSPGTNATSTAWYKKVDISIGVVDIQTFAKPSAGENTKINVKNNMNGKLMKDGDLIEAGTKVTVNITPLSGYYVTGNNVYDNVYSKIMKFSDYQEDIGSIISNHKAEKYVAVTLDKSDPYAAYTYELDGKEVTGTINAKAGQKLKLTYEITDSAYKLAKKSGGTIFNLGASETKATKTITITEEMDGKTITKADFQIETVKGD